MNARLTCPSCGTVCPAEHRFCPACGFPMEKLRDQAKDPLIGCTLPGGHVVMELIDVGGMGRVYRAEQQMLGRTVAVKIIHPHLLGDATVEARFITEARAASQLNHPNSVGVIDFGKFEGRLYMVMEYIRGRDLATVAHEEAPLKLERVVDVLTQTLAALEEAHHIGIIHRDLKPENIILSPLRSGGDFVKVLDFGLAKVREAAHNRITDPGMVCGTPEYMAPEQARGDDLDQRVDLYACGVLLYELLAGQLPFDGKTPRDVVLMHLSKSPPDLRVTAAHRDLPQPIIDVVNKAMSKDPDDRFQSASEFAMLLKTIMQPEALPVRAQNTLQKCARCSNMMPLRQKFCGECGARLFKPISTSPSLRELDAKPGGFPPPFVGRRHELRWLDDRRHDASASLLGALIGGAPGVGRTRLLERFCGTRKREGDLVINMRPDPWWAQPGYYALQQLIRDLGIGPENGTTSSWPGIPPEARAGMMIIFGHGKGHDKGSSNGNGRPWLSAQASGDASEQRALVAEALRWALTGANDRTGGVVVLVVDDLQAIDGASRNALRDVLSDPPLMGGMIVAAHNSDFEVQWDGCDSMTLHGMPLDVAASIMGDEADMLEEAAAGLETVVPLYLEQLLRFAAEGGSHPPRGLADLVALRIERFPADTRRVLQAIAVLGDITTSLHLMGMVPDVNELSRCLTELDDAGIVKIDQGEAAISHPFIRDVILTSTPHAVRTEMHGNARRDFGIEGQEMPVEAKAIHAYHADESFEALMLLEQCAQASHWRSDHESAVNMWHLALDLARREMARGELDDPVGAVLMFSAKLGDALALAGKAMDAQGVLSEALNLADPNATERPRLLASLANAERLLGRADAAYNHLEEALRIAETNNRADLVQSLEEIRSRWVAGL